MSFVFFTDRDLGRQFPDILAASGATVERHHEVFAPATPDEEGLEYVGRNGRVAITHDRRIRHVPNELAAVLRHRVALLVVLGKAPYPSLAHNFVRTLPRIERFLATLEVPFIAKVRQPHPAERALNPDAPGSIEAWYP